MTTITTGPAELRRLAEQARGWSNTNIADYIDILVAAWEADRNMLNSETARADAAELRANVLSQRDETETMNIGAVLFAMALRDDTGAGEMPAGPCADVLAEWRQMRASLGDSERLVTELVSDVAHARNRAERAEAANRDERGEWSKLYAMLTGDDGAYSLDDLARAIETRKTEDAIADKEFDDLRDALTRKQRTCNKLVDKLDVAEAALEQARVEIERLTVALHTYERANNTDLLSHPVPAPDSK